mgnify:CR=1 FL=1
MEQVRTWVLTAGAVVLALLIIVNLRQSRADIKKQQGEERR